MLRGIQNVWEKKDSGFRVKPGMTDGCSWLNILYKTFIIEVYKRFTGFEIILSC